MVVASINRKKNSTSGWNKLMVEEYKIQKDSGDKK